MIQTRGLTKSFGSRTALTKIDLSIAPGEYVTLMGPNGAGKTTLLRVVGTIARPTSGSVRIAGLDPAKRGDEVRRRIGFLSHRTLLYDDLTAEQNLRFYARMYEIPDGPERITEMLERVGLSSRRRDLAGGFSRGMQQRLSLARAVLHRPELLLLDEPYTGLDPNAAEVLTDLLGGLVDEGRTIVLTTHSLERGLSSGRRIIILVQGRVVYDAQREDMDPGAFPGLYRSLAS
jgi:heme exporter protein A